MITNALTEKLIIIFSFLLGLGLTLIIPPLQKPDEATHFLKSLAISHGQVWCEKENNLSIPTQFNSILSDANLKKLPFHKERKLDLDSYQQQVQQSADYTQKTKQDLSYLCAFPAFPYIPHAIGLKIGEVFHMNGFFSFMLGRLLSFLVYFGSIVFLYSKIKGSLRFIPLFLLSLPMVLHQLGAYSYDAFHILISITYFYLILQSHLLKKLDKKYFIFLFFSIVLLLLTRVGGYELLPLFICLIPPDKISKNKWRYITTLCLFLLALYTVFFVSKFSLYTHVHQFNLVHGANPMLQLHHIISQPFEYILTLIKTTVHFMKFYIEGIVGIFGFLEYGVLFPVYFVYIGIVIFLLLKMRLPKKIIFSTVQFFLGFSVLLGTYIILLTIFYLVWTPVGAHISDGAQGRYFIPLLPFGIFLLVALKEKYIPRLTFRLKIPNWIIIAVMGASYLSVFYTILSRYYF